MTEKKRPPESDDKAGEGASDATPMEKFKALAQRIVSTPRDRVRRERELYERKAAKKKKRNAD